MKVMIYQDRLQTNVKTMLKHDVVRSLVTQVTGYLQWLINTFTQLEIEMNSIERVKVRRKKTQRCVTFFRHIYSWCFS